MNYIFGDFRIDPQRRVLARRSGEPVTIGDKAFDALLYLVRHSGHVVSRATLAATLWPKAAAAGNNLSQAIKALRFALDDAAHPHRYVATVQRRGYQFVAEVVEGDACEPATARERPDTAAQGAPPNESDHSVRPAVSRWRASLLPLLAVVSVAALALIVSPLFAPPCVSNAAAPDRVVPSAVSQWPLPPLVACAQDSRQSASLRCEALRAAANDRLRQWKRGLQRT